MIVKPVKVKIMFIKLKIGLELLREIVQCRPWEIFIIYDEKECNTVISDYDNLIDPVWIFLVGEGAEYNAHGILHVYESQDVRDKIVYLNKIENLRAFL
jgi:hypothetical protein